MQLAINASQAPRRTSNLTCCDCSKQKSSISLGAVKAEVALIKNRQVAATNAHFDFMTILVSPSRSSIRATQKRTRQHGYFTALMTGGFQTASSTQSDASQNEIEILEQLGGVHLDLEIGLAVAVDVA
jgi:hypothetical protein